MKNTIEPLPLVAIASVIALSVAAGTIGALGTLVLVDYLRAKPQAVVDLDRDPWRERVEARVEMMEQMHSGSDAH